MDLFARCFLLVFGQIYVGGLLALSVPPFQEIERGFYKSTAGVFIGSGLLALLGRGVLVFWPAQGASPLGAAQVIELALLVVSLTAACIYLWSLWSEAYELRARSYVSAWMTGVASLTAAAQSFRLDQGFGIESFLFPLSLVAGALVLGAVCAGMLLGHWYLIDLGLSMEPFHRIFRYFARVLAVQTGVLIATGLLLVVFGHPPTADALTRLWNDHMTLVASRVAVSPFATAVLAWMIWKTLQIPQTMAATGLLYIAILSVLVGEFLGRFILFRTGLPL